MTGSERGGGYRIVMIGKLSVLSSQWSVAVERGAHDLTGSSSSNDYRPLRAGEARGRTTEPASDRYRGLFCAPFR